MIDFSDRKIRIKLFGDEDALKDDPKRLREYYFKGLPYKQVISDDKLCLLVGHKGTGKSALLKVAHYEDIDTHKASILINAYDLGKNKSSTNGETDLTTYVRDWKKRLSEQIIDSVFRCLDIRGETLLKLNKGFKDNEYTDQDITFYLKLKFKEIGDNGLNDNAKKLLENFLEDEKIPIYIDEVDTLWSQGKRILISLDKKVNYCINGRTRIYWGNWFFRG